MINLDPIRDTLRHTSIIPNNFLCIAHTHTHTHPHKVWRTLRNLIITLWVCNHSCKMLLLMNARRGDAWCSKYLLIVVSGRYCATRLNNNMTLNYMRVRCHMAKHTHTHTPHLKLARIMQHHTHVLYMSHIESSINSSSSDVTAGCVMHMLSEVC